MRRSNARALDRKSEERMDSIKLHFRPNAPHRSNLSSRNSKQATNVTKSNILVFALVLISLALLCYLVVVVSSGNRSSEKRKYGIVIDGGSTGTRIHVFEYEIRDGVLAYDFEKNGLASMRVNPGLSSYSEDPSRAGGSLADLVDFARERIPKEHWGRTEIRLMATAGLRLLDLSVQERILDSCRRVLAASGFKFRNNWASVITGSDEGIYAWIVANYALGALGHDPKQTTGIIELGGASAQVTFVTNEPMPPEFSHPVKYGNMTYNLYSHSFLHFGQNVAFDLLRESLLARSLELATESLQRERSVDPCIPKGYPHYIKSWSLNPGSLVDKNIHISSFQSGGNFSECRNAALTLLQEGKENCSYHHCYIGSTYIPKLQGKFLATENFFYTSKFFGLAPKGLISDLMRAGEQFCGDDWSNLKMKYHTLDEDDLSRYCFSSAYIVALLHDSLGIPLDDERIGFTNQVGDIPLDWALGAFILQSTNDLESEHSIWFVNVGRDDSSTLLALFLIAIILTCTAWFISKWKNPQLKTIYDLEKGKYIVTRISR